MNVETIAEILDGLIQQADESFINTLLKYGLDSQETLKAQAFGEGVEAAFLELVKMPYSLWAQSEPLREVEP